MNTSVFAEEVALDSTDEVAVVTVDEAEAAVDSVQVDAAETEHPDKIEDGFIKTWDKNKNDFVYKTVISYEKDPTNKKATVPDVATITDVSDPVSWNSLYGEDLIATVLTGSNASDTWLNNYNTVTVSEDKKALPVGRRNAKDGWRYKVIKVSDGVYLFTGYGVANLDDDNFNAYYRSSYVEGTDDPAEYLLDGSTYNEMLPVAEWDGRPIDFNKSGIYKFAKGKKEALDVKVALVTYDASTQTVKEIPGVEANVKVDKKNQKAASVEAVVTPVVKEFKYFDYSENKLQTYKEAVDEYKKIGDLPFFTLSVKTKGKDAKKYAGDLKKVMGEAANNKYYFGLMKKTIYIYTDDVTSEFNQSTAYDPVIDKDTRKTTGYTVSEAAIKRVEEKIAKSLVDGKYKDMDVDEKGFGFSCLKVTKFNASKPDATIEQFGYTGDRKKGYKWEALKALKNKTDYEFTKDKVADTDVAVLNFKGSYVYTPITYTGDLDSNDKLVVSIANYGRNGLSGLGYKWAFRQSPVDKKNFRHGIFLNTNQGFVYNVED